MDTCLNVCTITYKRHVLYTGQYAPFDSQFRPEDQGRSEDVHDAAQEYHPLVSSVVNI